MENFEEPVFYLPARNGAAPEVIDWAKLDGSGVLVGEYLRQPIEQVRKDYPDAQVGEYVTIRSIREAMLRTQPSEISEEDFIDMREMCPPLDFQCAGQGSSFKMSEHLSGRVTSIYAAMNGRFFTFVDIDTLSHSEIMSKVSTFLGQKQEVAA